MRSAKFVGFALPPISVDAEGEPLANARSNMGGRVDRGAPVFSVVLPHVRPRCSPTDQREPLSRWAALSCVAQRLPWACGTVSETFMLHALIFFGAHAALLVVVLLVG